MAARPDPIKSDADWWRMMAWPKHSGLNIRKTHPTLYHSIMTLGFAGVALAFNFWFARPTFHPYGWNKNYVGLVFCALGVGQLVFLNLFRDLRVVRLLLAASISWTLFWGASNTIQFFDGRASLQLPILYMAVSILQVPFLVEAPVNPMTKKQQ